MTYSSKYINRNFLIKVSGRNYESEYINKLVGVSGLIELIGEGEHGRKLNQARKAAAYTEKDFMKDRKECIGYNGREYADRWYNLAKKEQIIADRRKTGEDIIARLNRIAYLRQTPG